MLMLCVGMSAWADRFNTTYSYGLSGWSLTNYTDQSSYYQVPSGNDPSVATISGIFSGKTITSNVVVTINCATYGSGTNPSASTFSLYKETACTTAITATKGGTLPTSSTYTDVTYTVTQANAASLGDDLAIKITKPGKTIRLKSIKVEFTYTTEGGSTNYTVTVANDIANGTVTANPTSAAEGATVTLTATPDKGYEFGSWNVTNASTSAAITVTDNRFTMPAAKVNVSATFNEIPAFEGTITTISADDAADIKFVTGSSSATGAVWANSTPLTANNITLSGSVTSGTNYSYYDGSVVRFYTNNNIVITPSNGATIVKVEIVRQSTTSSNTGTINCSGLTASNDNTTTNTNVYTGSATSAITFTNTAQARFTKIIIYSIGSTPDTPETPTVTAPTFDVAAGTYTEDQLVVIDNYSSDYLYAYTLDGTDPTFGAELNVTNGTAYDNDEGIGITSTCTLKVIAVDENGNASSITSAAYTINKPQVFANLEALVAAELTSGTNVTVSFENVAIKSFQTASGTRKGVYFDIQKGGKDIEIYFNSAIPAEWVEGGTLSGTLTNCPWKLYNETWELAPTSGWAWTNLTYTAPTTNVAPTFTTNPIGTTYKLNDPAEILTVVASGVPAPTYQWYSNTTKSNENGTILEGETQNTYKPSTTKAGNFYYYCVATNSEGSAKSNVVIITVEEPTLASLPFSFDGGVSDIAKIKGMSQSGLGSDYSSSPKLKFDNQGDNMVINFNEAAKKVTYTIKGNGTSGTYAFDVMESADGIEYTTVHSHTSITDATSYTDKLNAASRFVKFVYTTKASGNVALGNISIVAASYVEEPELVFEKASYRFVTTDEKKVTATSKKNSDGDITYSCEDQNITIDATTGVIIGNVAGTYTITANIAKTDDYNSGTATCTINIIEPAAVNSIIVAEANNKYYAMTNTCEETYMTSVEIAKIGNKYVVNKEVINNLKFAVTTANGKTTILTKDNLYLQSTAAKNVNLTENEYYWTNDGEKLTAETASYGTLQYNTSSPRFTTYASKVGQYATIVDLSNVIVGEVVTVSDAGYATYYNDFAYTMPEGLEGKILTKTAEGITSTTVFSEGDVVPANAPLLIKGAKGTYTLTSTTEEANADLTGNLLHGSNGGTTTGATGNEKYYILGNGKNGLGWYWGATNGAAFTLGAGKCYLVVDPSTTSEAKSFFAIEGDEEDAIMSVENKANNTIYDLQGRRVNGSQKGLYIINGKKVIR